MRVLVTGGTGFLGGRCLRALAASGRFDASATGRRLSSAPAGFDFIAADLSEPGALARLPAVDAVAKKPFPIDTSEVISLESTSLMT